MDDILRIKTEIDSATTVKELEALRRQVTNARKEQKTWTVEYQQLAKIEVELKNEIHNLNKVAYSDNAKIKESYFNVGEELRRFYHHQRVGDRTMREAAATAQMFGLNLGGLFNSFQQAEFAVNALGIAAQGAGGKLGSIGQMMSGIAVPAALGVDGILYYVNAMRELEDQTRKAHLELVQAQIAAGGISPEDQKRMLDAEIEKIQAARDSMAKVLPILRGRYGETLPSIFGVGSTAELEAMDKQLIQLRGQSTELYKKIIEQQYAFTGPRAPTADELKKIVDAQVQLEEKRLARIKQEENLFREKEAKMGVRLSLSSGPELGDIMRPKFGEERDRPSFETFLPEGAARLDLKQRGFKLEYAAGKEFEPAKVELSALEDRMAGLASMVGSTLTSAFAGVFNFANNEVGRLGANIVATLGESLFSTLFSYIPFIGPAFDRVFQFGNGGMINEPVVGMGASGRGYIIGERGPEMVVPVSGRGGADFTQMVRAINGLRSDFATSHPVSLVKAVAYSQRQTSSSIF